MKVSTALLLFTGFLILAKLLEVSIMKQFAWYEVIAYAGVTLVFVITARDAEKVKPETEE